MRQRACRRSRHAYPICGSRRCQRSRRDAVITWGCWLAQARDSAQSAATSLKLTSSRVHLCALGSLTVVPLE
eukprot:543384-Pyramimonas_sp.AAC.1